MTDSTMFPAIKAAIKANEISGGDPYSLSFAGKANSGASFGIFQNDTAANSQALAALKSILQQAGLPAGQVTRIIQLVSKPCPTNPLKPEDTEAANDALSSADGMKAVDALDEKRLKLICGYLNDAVDSAKDPIEGKAQLGICMWCNMTGPPSTMLTWLGGSAVDEPGGKVDPPGNPVSFDDLTRLLKKTTYFTNNPRNWQHFADSAEEGAKLLPHGPAMLRTDQPPALTGTEAEFSRALLAIMQRLTSAQSAGAPSAFPHGIGTIDISATIEPAKISLSFKITDAAGKLGSPLVSRLIDTTGDQILKYCVSLDEADDGVMTDCNAFVKKVASNFGVTIDSTADADKIVDSFGGAPFTKTTTDPKVAMGWAKDGMVVAGMKKSELDGHYGNYTHGHVAIVHNAEDQVHKGFPMASWGTIGGRGRSNTTIRQSFKAKACDDKAVHFAFAPTS
ncbi:hypothetical protein AB8A05_15390 [Tardiphaga sp. 538_B7_N1_4]|uniref:hypothetical protein n=1 Tax=Tardiphaga sp. 538_B7_N1_4 TaxID=3240778 RepID=UPI003F20EA3C